MEKKMINFGKAFSTVSDIASFLGQGLGMKELLDLFKGSIIPNSADLKAKGWKGVIGLGDEQEFDALLLSIDEGQNKNSTGYRNAILDYLDWNFKPSKDPDSYELLVLWYTRNKWRTYVLGLPATETKHMPSKETTVEKKADGSSTTTTKEGHVPMPGEDYPRKWLIHLAEEIIAGNDKRIATYKAICKKHRTIGVPCPPKSRIGILITSRRIAKELSNNIRNKTVKAARTAHRGVASNASNFSATVKEHARNIEIENAKRSLVVRFFLNLIS
jgi:hypothetical protein